ncbi:MAG: Gfo/Idh/MocA family protein [Planctomycetota bacterium]
MRRRVMVQGLAGFMSGCLQAAGAITTVARSAPFRVAVIGHTGRGNYGHGLDVMWQRLDGAELVAVADADASGLQAATKLLGLQNGFADYRRMLNELRPDIAAITPRHVDQHHEMLLAAIAAGVKGIFIEKPFVRTPQEGDEVLAAASRARVQIAVAHRNRCHPVLPVIQRLLDDGLIGRVLELRGRGKEDPRGGSLDLWVLGSHVMNLAAYFGGAPRACSAGVYVGGEPVAVEHIHEGAEGLGLMAGDEVHARFELSSGVPFFFDSLKNARLQKEASDRPASFGLQIIGTKGIVDLRADQHPFARVRLGSPLDPDGAAGNWDVISTAGVGQPEPLANLSGDLAGQLVGGRDLLRAITDGRPPLCDGAQGLQTVEMICSVFESHRLGGRRVTFPLETRGNPWTLMPRA